MSEQAGTQDVQHFTENGTWVKPAGAVKVEVILKGGTGGAAQGILGGRGGDPALFGGLVIAGGGGGAGASSHLAAGTPTAAGGEGGTAGAVFDAADLPERMPVTVGAGGYARIVTDLAS